MLLLSSVDNWPMQARELSVRWNAATVDRRYS
jgi:hypothetical protein